MPERMSRCSACGNDPPLCERCRDQQLLWCGSAALRAGDEWAASVARQLHGRGSPPSEWPPWPDYDGSERVRSIALRKVDHRDEAVAEELAKLCWKHAAWRYERLRIEWRSR